MLGTYLAPKSLGRNTMQLVGGKKLPLRFGKRPMTLANRIKRLGNNKRIKEVRGRRMISRKVKGNSRKGKNNHGRHIQIRDRSSGNNSRRNKKENRQDGNKSKLEPKKK